MQEITFRYPWSRETYLTAADAHDRFGQEKRLRIVGILILAECVLCLMSFGPASLTTGIFLLLALYWYLFRRWIFLFQVGRIYDRMKLRDGQVEGRVTDGEVFSRCQIPAGARQEGTVTWDVLWQVIKTEKGFLLYYLPLYQWIPHQAFASSGEAAAFEALARQKVKAFYDKTRR